MAKKITLTRPELKRQRDALARYERFLPTLKLKQQQLQATMRQILRERRQAIRAVQAIRQRLAPYQAVMADTAGVNIEQLSEPEKVQTSERNVAGVAIPVFEGIEFATITYSLFGTPAWVDQTLQDLRERSRRQAQREILERQYELLNDELTKITQRVNLFEKVMIPEAREAIRRIRIHLGDQMTASVARAKIAKAKLSEKSGEGATEEYCLS